ncbi:MAG: YqgE/AlgH family protein [Deltaproteobacteria bacterium]|nr:YqgE/AlgH family protein [Deltaproteobacteria bacterium]
MSSPKMDLKNFKPCFLIAMPELLDPNFFKSVVFLTEYNEHGASGFIINRPTDLVLGKSIILTESTLNPAYNEVHLYNGGPVEKDKLWIIYDGSYHSDPNDAIIADNIVIARDILLLTDHERTLNPAHFKIIHGFSGWGPAQLEKEIAVSAWITCPLSHALFFETQTEKIWQSAIKALGIDPHKLIGPQSPFVN